MSELKAYRFLGIDEIWTDAAMGSLYYSKSEADKVIAEKDKEIAELQKQVHDYAQGLYVIQASAEKEAHHHKYKRCLAMALVWFERAENSTDWKNELVSRKRFSKWMELVEKFKEKKNCRSSWTARS